MKPTCAVLLCASAALALELSSAAHHSVAVNFERGAPIEIRGTVKEANIRNPHSQYVVAVSDKDGAVTDWLVEWSDPQFPRAAQSRYRPHQSRRHGHVHSVAESAAAQRRLLRPGRIGDGSVYRDCGFVKYREAVANSTEFRCDEGSHAAPQQ